MSNGSQRHAPRKAGVWALAILVAVAASGACENRDSRKEGLAQEAPSIASPGSDGFDDAEVGAYDAEIEEQLEALGYAELAPVEDGPS